MKGKGETYHINRRLVLPVNKPPDGISQEWPDKPSGSTAGRGRHTQNNKWIQAHDLRTQILQILTRKYLQTGHGGSR
jgi:hypothetical protein